jgi:hypothetical protein
MADPKLTMDEGKPDEPEEIVVIAEGEQPPAQSAPEADEDDDHDDDDGYEDLRIADSAEEDVSERRKRERKERKERQRIARQKKDEELELLRQQNQQLAERLNRVESGIQGQQVQSVEQRLGWARQHLQIAETQIADAVSRGDGEAHIKALKYRDEARSAIYQLEATKKSTTARAEPQEEQRPQTPQADPEITRHATDWIKSNPWFDYNSNEPRVLAAKKIESELVAEGYSPRDRSFWTELTKRTKETAVTPKPRTNGGPPVAGAGDSGAPNGKVTYRLSQERINAMKDAGIWDDPVKKDKQIRAYMTYDKQNAR